VLRISPLRRGETRHARVSDLLNGDFWGGEEGCGFVPDGLVEREGVGKEAVGSAACAVKSVSGQCVGLWDEGSREMDWQDAYLRLKSCSSTPSRPRVSRSKVRAKGAGLVRTACENRMMASLLAMLKPSIMAFASMSRVMSRPFEGR
jgi:hypothetical protein